MDIVLVILDTARGDTVNSLIESGNLPNLEALAQNGAWYTKARSTGPWTVPSHASLFTGKYPSEVGITGHDPTYDTVPLIKELNTRGYKTAGFSANPWLSPDFNFDEPYDQFFTKYTFYPTGASMASIVNEDSSMGDRVSDFISEIKGTPISKSIVNTGFWAYQRYFREDSGGYHLLKRAANWLNTGNDDKFAFLNITEPHLPYELPRDWLPEGVSQESLNQIEQDTAKYLAGVSEVSKEDLYVFSSV